MEDTGLIKALLDLGTSAILLYFIFELWKDRQKKDAERMQENKDKDLELHDLNDKILEVVKENTKVQSELTQAVQANTKSNETLTSKIYDVLTKNGNRTNNSDN